MDDDQHIPAQGAPTLTAPIAYTVAALAMFAACIFMAFGEPSPTTVILMVTSAVIVIAVAVLQWVVYGRAYIDYRIGQQASQ